MRYLLAAVLLSGCATTPGWEYAHRSHVCTEEQAERVERVVRFCTRREPLFEDYCRGAAMVNNCSPRGGM